MTRNRTKVWDLNYVTVIMSETTKVAALAGLGESDSGRAHARELLDAAQSARAD